METNNDLLKLSEKMGLRGLEASALSLRMNVLMTFMAASLSALAITTTVHLAIVPKMVH